MPDSGGSAAINGFLYQILGALHWATSFRLSLPVEPDEHAWPKLIIEPEGGGGDLQVYLPSRQVVEQWKARSGGRTWSINEVAQKVFPDLYLAVDGNALDAVREYRFVTEGRLGDWANASEFFEKLDRVVPIDPLSYLDDSVSTRFAQDYDCSPREFFRRIVDTVIRRLEKDPQRGALVSNDSPEMRQRKVWHLLSRFRFIGEWSEAECKRQVNQRLAAVVGVCDDIDVKRRQLVGYLMEQAAAGEVQLTPSQLFQHVGIVGTPLTRLSEIAARLQTTLRERFAFLKYRPANDVRTAPVIPDDKQVLIVAGDSGQGKTWQLCALAASIANGRTLPVLMRTFGKATDDLAEATAFLCNRILQQSSPGNLDALLRRLHEVHPGLDFNICVLVDGVDEVIEAARLIAHIDGEPRIKLAFTSTREVGRAIARQHEGRVHLLELGDFNTEELKRYLEMRGHDWLALPPDVRSTLQRPLLAGIYSDVARDLTWTPTHEYDLYERHWRRIGERDPHRQLAADLLASAAASLITDSDPVYPWPRLVLHDKGIGSDDTAHLEATGWLTSLGPKGEAIWHDRLLNWAVAEGLLALRRANTVSSQGLHEIARELQLPGRQYAGKRLAYVPMDLLWLACDPDNRLAGEVGTLIEAAESWTVEPLYKELLPTLGKRIIPGLIARVSAAESVRRSTLALLAAETIIRIGMTDRNSVNATMTELLHGMDPDFHAVALSVIAQQPDAAKCDRIWQLDCEASEAVDPNDSNARSVRLRRRERSFRALSACVREDPMWLVGAIASTSGIQELARLAFVVASLPKGKGGVVWNRVKEKLLSIGPAADRLGLVHCVRRFSDLAEVPRLAEWVQDTDGWVSGFSLAALARLQPEAAIAALPDAPKHTLATFNRQWLPLMVLRDPIRTRRSIRALVSSGQVHELMIAELYRSCPNSLDRETLEILLDGLEQNLIDAGDRGEGEDHPGVSLYLELLSRVWRQELLGCFRNRRSSDLEDHLALYACERIGKRGPWSDRDLEHARTILMKVGGAGFTRLVDAELEHDDFHIRYRALRWCLVRPDQQTRTILQLFLSGAVYTDPQQSFVLRRAAMEKLASLSEKRNVLTAMLRSGYCGSRRTLAALNDGEPIAKDVLVEAIKALADHREGKKAVGAYVVAVNGERDLAYLLEDVVGHSAAGGVAARVAVQSLAALGHHSDPVMRLLEQHLDAEDEDSRVQVSALLTDFGGRDERSFLLEKLRAASKRALSIHERELLARLYRREREAGDERTMRQVAELIWEDVHLNLSRIFKVPQGYMVALGDSGSPEIRDWLIDLLVAGHLSNTQEECVGDALRALGKLDPESANRIGQHLLGNPRVTWQVASALLDVDKARAVPLLVDLLATERRCEVRWSIGRLLRSARGLPDLETSRKELASRSHVRARRAACELGAWLCSDCEELSAIAVEDEDERVSQTAVWALERIADEVEARKLIADFSGASADERWIYLQAILETADPYLLFQEGEDLYIGGIVARDPGYEAYVDDQLAKAKKRVQEEAKRVDDDDHLRSDWR